MYPKPSKKRKGKREPLNFDHQTHSRRKIYRFIAKPCYFAGLAAGQRVEGDPVCERCEEKAATQIHHRRGRVGPDLLNYREFAALCSECHEWVHANPDKAFREGWLRSRHPDPEPEGDRS